MFLLKGSIINAGTRHGLTGLIIIGRKLPLKPLAGTVDVLSFAEEIHISARMEPCVAKRLKRKSGPLEVRPLQGLTTSILWKIKAMLLSPIGIELVHKQEVQI